MILFPNAKINLGLNVTEKRPDGYHNIETIFYPIGLSDALEIITSDDQKENVTWSSSGIHIDTPGTNNLCTKAYHLLKKDHDLPSIKMHLHKHTPIGAGLGGGSSDAAFTIKILNDQYHLNLSDDQMIKYASKLGADCAFFIQNKPVFASGIGDAFQPINFSLQGYYFVLINPAIHISTAEAYGGITPKKTTTKLFNSISLPKEEWKNHIFNDFEEGIFINHPKIKELKEELYQKGAFYASMSGSGSSVFGLFETPPKLHFPNYFCWEEQL